jgi:hypothetical protein
MRFAEKKPERFNCEFRPDAPEFSILVNQQVVPAFLGATCEAFEKDSREH